MGHINLCFNASSDEHTNIILLPNFIPQFNNPSNLSVVHKVAKRNGGKRQGEVTGCSKINHT